MVQIGKQGPEDLTGILKIIVVSVGPGETKFKIPDFVKYFSNYLIIPLISDSNLKQGIRTRSLYRSWPRNHTNPVNIAVGDDDDM